MAPTSHSAWRNPAPVVPLRMIETNLKIPHQRTLFACRVHPIEGYSPSDRMRNHIKLMQAYYLSGALEKSVSDQTFHDDFVKFFPGQKIFNPEFDSVFIRKKGITKRQCKLSVTSFIQFMGQGDDDNSAFLEAIHKFRDNLDTYSHLFETYTKICISRVNEDDDKEKATCVGREAYQIVKLATNGSICLPGFTTFMGEERYTDFLQYCHYFTSQIHTILE